MFPDLDRTSATLSADFMSAMQILSGRIRLEVRRSILVWMWRSVLWLPHAPLSIDRLTTRLSIPMNMASGLYSLIMLASSCRAQLTARASSSSMRVAFVRICESCLRTDHEPFECVRATYPRPFMEASVSIAKGLVTWLVSCDLHVFSNVMIVSAMGIAVLRDIVDGIDQSFLSLSVRASVAACFEWWRYW